MLRNALGDAYDQVHLRLHGLQDGLGRKGRGHVDHGRVGARGRHRLAHCVEHGKPQVLCAPLLGSYARNLLIARKEREAREEGMKAREEGRTEGKQEEGRKGGKRGRKEGTERGRERREEDKGDANISRCFLSVSSVIDAAYNAAS